MRYYRPKPRTSGPKAEGRSGGYVGHHWREPTPVLPDTQRTMPQTVPHEIIEQHPFGCECAPCGEYGALAVKLKRRHRGIQTPRRQRTTSSTTSVSA